MKWKTLASKITNRIRSSSTSSTSEQSPITDNPSTSSSTLSSLSSSFSFSHNNNKNNNNTNNNNNNNNNNLEVLNMDNVQVSVRIRPLIREEREIETIAWLWENNTITQDTSRIPLYKQTTLSRSALDQMQAQTSSTNYIFDNLFCPEHTNEHIFVRIVKPIIIKALQGYHGSIFSYGQTSSGKTFTMNGTSKQPGVIPLSIFECFESISQFRDREFLFRVSYLEIYNETVHDLLNPEVTQIKIQHDPKVGTILVGAKEQVVMNPAQVIALLQGGEAHRHVGSTDMNEKSSRAHTLFRLIIESKALSDSSDVPIRVSTLNLVDLAGSESAKMTNSKGIRAREAKYINQSLLTLSTIIHRLSEEDGNNNSKTTQHLPYRDSKLTRILQTALSGNALISIICTISPTVKCFEESNNTLKFATRAKKIKMDAKVNETVDDKTLLRAYRLEIEQLKAKLAEVEQAMQTVKATEQADPVEIEENQLFMLQMIDHMERLILKGEEKAKVEELALKERKTSDPKREMKSRKSEGIANGGLKSSNSSRKLGSSDNNNNNNNNNNINNSPAPIKREVSSNNSNSQLIENSSNDSNSNNNNTSMNQKVKKESKITAPGKKNVTPLKLNEKKGLTSNTSFSNSKDSSTNKSESKPSTSSLSNTDSIAVNDKLNIDSELKDKNNTTTINNNDNNDNNNKGEESNEQELQQERSHNNNNNKEDNDNEDNDNDDDDEEEESTSIENITTPRLNEIDVENEDFFAGINRNRESILRASHDVNDNQLIVSSPNKMTKRLSHSGLLNRDDLTSSSSFIIENILAGSRENLLQNIGYSSSSTSENKLKSTDPVLEGVSQMLTILKQHVQKTKQSVGGIIQDGNDAIMNISKNKGFQRKSAPNLSQFSDDGTIDEKAELIHKLKMELHLKEADNKFLQTELDKLNEHINSKDNMLNMLTEGLKEVEVNQANLLSANDALSVELDMVHRAYEEVVSENEILKNEVRRLMICLDAREKQYFEATGRKLEEEEF